jgi:transcriptional regulator with XRE-family HTH domain
MLTSFKSSELRAELARRRWRQRDLADATGLSLSYIGWLCRGGYPGERAAKRITKALGRRATATIFGGQRRGGMS